MQSSLISIIIPTYNYARFIGETLKSVADQIHSNWECIIVDDGSTDNTKEIVNNYLKNKKFQYIYQSNSGLSSARNAGIAQAKGNYFQFLDSDDLINSSKLLFQAKFLDDHESIDIVFGNTFYFNESNHNRFNQSSFCENMLLHNHINKLLKAEEALKKLLINNIMAVSAPLIRNNVIEKVGMFNQELNSYEDWEYWMRCAMKGHSFYYYPFNGTETWIRQGHTSMMSNRKILTENGIKIRRHLKKYLKGVDNIYNQYRLMKLIGRQILRRY